MPAIRDYSYAYESTTTDGGLTLPICTHEIGDLLVAFLVGDTGTPTVGVSSSSGWFQIFQRVNTCSLTVMAKYVTAVEPDVVMTASVTETYSGVLVAIQDVFQGYSSGSLPVLSQVASTPSGTLVALPTITTTTDNSLCMAVLSNAAPSSVSFSHDALQSLIMVDGAAEGVGVGWFFKKAAGLTTAYNAATISSQNGAKAVIEFRAPTGGAELIPAYPVADTSVLLSPSLPVIYDGSTAFAATADTNFGTTIAGRTCNDGTLTTVADVGIDSGAFMSMSGMTNAASATAMSGAEAVMPAGKYNVGTSNVLCHFRHPTPIQNQRLSTVNSGRGIWFGMRSAAANYKVWQVHGSDAPLTPGYVQPIVINFDNTDLIGSAGTPTSNDIRSYGFWCGGIGTLTQQACFGPLWSMGLTTLAGGNDAYPMGIQGVARAAALNKIRFSSIVQGNNQMLCLQAIQFGDGGTNPVYLGLDSTAIEFPSKRNVTKKLVNYNGTDNLIGFTYYPGAGDTIIHRASVVSSPSLYHWRIHASASASATYDFNGLSLIGAGDVQLRPVVTFTGMSFTSCLTVYTNLAQVDGCVFTNSKVFPSTLAGLALVTNCEFTKTAGTTHAIEVGGSAATVDLTGLTFTGYAGTNGSTGNEAIYVNIASGTVTLNVSGGTTPSIRTAGATVNVVAGAVTTSLLVTDVSGTPIQNAQVMVAASAGPLPFNASVTITNSGTTATVAHVDHTLSTGDKVRVKGASHYQNNGVFTITVTGTGAYTYTMLSAPGSNPTGTITSTFVALYGTTDVNGLISASRVFPSNQPVSGWARKSSDAPYYKTGPVSGTINSSTGASLSALLIADA